jgi:hypothetical protein
MTPDALLDLVVNDARAIVEPLGFKKERRTFRLYANGNCGIIEFHRFSRNDGKEVWFTLNCGVICGAILADHARLVRKPTALDAHLRFRPGDLVAGCRAWSLNAAGDAQTTRNEVSQILRSTLAPYIVRHMTNEALIALWRTGKSPGATDLQRMSYLAALCPNP